MVMAFCLDRKDIGHGKRQMTVAGSAYLEVSEEPPQPMILAATMLRVPGFSMIPFDTGKAH
jgi:hypothetical protein